MIVSKRNIKTTTDGPTNRWFHDFFLCLSRLDSLNVMLAAIFSSSFNSAQFFFCISVVSLLRRRWASSRRWWKYMQNRYVDESTLILLSMLAFIAITVDRRGRRALARYAISSQTAWVSNDREENEKNHANALAAVGWSSETMTTTTTEGNSRRLFMKWKCSAISEKCRKIGKLISMEVTASSSSEVLRKWGKLPVWEFNRSRLDCSSSTHTDWLHSHVRLMLQFRHVWEPCFFL